MSQSNHIKNRRLHSLDFRLKLTEVSLVSVCMGLGLDAFANGKVPQWPGIGCCCILTGAYVIITGVTIGCTIFAQPLPRPVGVAFSVVGAVLLATVAVAVLRAWRSASTGPPPAAGRTSWMTGLQQMRLLGLLALAAAATYTLDAAHAAIVGPWLVKEHETTRQAVASAVAGAACAALDTPSSPERHVPRSAHSARAWESLSPSMPMLQHRGVASATSARGIAGVGASRALGGSAASSLSSRLATLQRLPSRTGSVASSMPSARTEGAPYAPLRRPSAPVPTQRSAVGSTYSTTTCSDSQALRLRRPSTPELEDTWKPNYIGGQTIDEARYCDYRRERY